MLPKTITHEKRLKDCASLLQTFLPQAAPLGAKLGCLLVQLSPGLAFDKLVAEVFLQVLRQSHAGPAALEARHAS